MAMCLFSPTCNVLVFQRNTQVSLCTRRSNSSCRRVVYVVCSACRVENCLKSSAVAGRVNNVRGALRGEGGRGSGSWMDAKRTCCGQPPPRLLAVNHSNAAHTAEHGANGQLCGVCHWNTSIHGNCDCASDRPTSSQ